MSIRNNDTSCANRRSKVAQKKPRVHDKLIAIKAKYEAGKSTAIIQLQYDYRCNMFCEHCSIQPYRVRSERRSLTPDDVQKIFDQADKLGLARAVITGGEPLTFPDLDDVVDAIGPDRFYINCDSNGWLLTPTKAKHLVGIGVDRIQLSIDSFFEEDHDDFRRKKGSWKRAFRGLKSCLDAGLDVYVQTVVTKERLYSQEFRNFIEHINAKGVDVFVTFAKPVGGWSNRRDMMIDQHDLDYFGRLEEQYRLFSHLTPAHGLDMGCIAVKGMISITQYGDVQPCPYMHISLGNVFEEPLADIIQRGLDIRWFGEHISTCPIAMDSYFIKKYIDVFPISKGIPIRSEEVFSSDSDKTHAPFNHR